jgi:hypothetical protein
MLEVKVNSANLTKEDSMTVMVVNLMNNESIVNEDLKANRGRTNKEVLLIQYK